MSRQNVEAQHLTGHEAQEHFALQRARYDAPSSSAVVSVATRRKLGRSAPRAALQLKPAHQDFRVKNWQPGIVSSSSDHDSILPHALTLMLVFASAEEPILYSVGNSSI